MKLIKLFPRPETFVGIPNRFVSIENQPERPVSSEKTERGKVTPDMVDEARQDYEKQRVALEDKVARSLRNPDPAVQEAGQKAREQLRDLEGRNLSRKQIAANLQRIRSIIDRFESGGRNQA
jgi:nitrogen-specific signal transduction histidine kinase